LVIDKNYTEIDGQRNMYNMSCVVIIASDMKEIPQSVRGLKWFHI